MNSLNVDNGDVILLPVKVGENNETLKYLVANRHLDLNSTFSHNQHGFDSILLFKEYSTETKKIILENAHIGDIPNNVINTMTQEEIQQCQSCLFEKIKKLPDNIKNITLKHFWKLYKDESAEEFENMLLKLQFYGLKIIDATINNLMINPDDYYSQYHQSKEHSFKQFLCADRDWYVQHILLLFKYKIINIHNEENLITHFLNNKTIIKYLIENNYRKDLLNQEYSQTNTNGDTIRVKMGYFINDYKQHEILLMLQKYGLIIEKEIDLFELVREKKLNYNVLQKQQEFIKFKLQYLSPSNIQFIEKRKYAFLHIYCVSCIPQNILNEKTITNFKEKQQLDKRFDVTIHYWFNYYLMKNNIINFNEEEKEFISLNYALYVIKKYLFFRKQIKFQNSVYKAMYNPTIGFMHKRLMKELEINIKN